MLPRQFLVKSILNTLNRNRDVRSAELLASRIADQVEIAADIFESNDDAMPVPPPNVRHMQAGDTPDGYQPGGSGTPEDLLADIVGGRRRAVENLPQPSMIVAPDSPEGIKVLSRKAVTPIRVARPGGGGYNEGEVRNWDFQDLYASVTGMAPLSIEVTPTGADTPVTLDRSFQADPSAGVIKLVYTLAGQRDSAPSTPDDPLAVVTIPIDVSASFSVYSSPNIDFPAVITGLKKTAAGSFASRPASILSATRRTRGSLDNIYRSAMAENQRTGPGADSPDSTFANAAIDLSR